MGGSPAASVLLFARGCGGVACRHAAAVAPRTLGPTGCHAGIIPSILSPSSLALMRSTRLSHWIRQATFHPWLRLISAASTFPFEVLTVIRPSFGVWMPLRVPVFCCRTNRLPARRLVPWVTSRSLALSLLQEQEGLARGRVVPGRSGRKEGERFRPESVIGLGRYQSSVGRESVIVLERKTQCRRVGGGPL